MCKYITNTLTILFIAIDIIHFIFGIKTTFNNIPYMTSCSGLLPYILIAALFSIGNFFSKIRIIHNIYNNRYWFMHINTIIYLAMISIIIIWGAIIYTMTGDICFDTYIHGPSDIFTMYHITFWYYVGQICLLQFVGLVFMVSGYCMHNCFHFGNANASIYVRFAENGEIIGSNLVWPKIAPI